MEGRQQYFNLQLYVDDKGAPPYFRDRLTVRVEKAYQFLAQLIPAKLISQVDVNLWLFSSESDYTRFHRGFPHRGYTSGTVAALQGFHSAAENVAAALWITDEQVLATSVHEAVHVMNAGMFGHVPRWLNEGMAEYLENIQVYGQAAEITVPQIIYSGLIRIA